MGSKKRTNDKEATFVTMLGYSEQLVASASSFIKKKGGTNVAIIFDLKPG